jgi:5-formyltetrahydrofolate cyclo-ligase
LRYISRMTEAPLLAAKAEARRSALAARQARPEAGPMLRDILLAQAPPPRGAIIGGFWSMGSEIDTRPLLEALQARGHIVALPVTPPRGNPLLFRPWSPGTPMAQGPMGTQHPAEGAPVHPTWLIVPLLAFDRGGARLGYGGGYYDRTLALLRASNPRLTAIGVAYAAQEIAQVPTGPHDARLDAIATEQGLIRP